MSSGKHGRLYRALFPYDTGKEDDLRFRANDVITVLDDSDGEREAWWFGELEGRRGVFPGTFVTPLSARVKTIASSDDQEHIEPGGSGLTQEEKEALQRHQAAEKARLEWEDRLGQAFTTAEKESKAKHNVRFDERTEPEVLEVWSRFEYDRKGEFNPEVARMEWDTEEEEEKLRQLEDRWQHFERNLPPGTKCDERQHFEKLKAEHERRQREAEEQAKERRAAHKKKLMEARAARKNKGDGEERIGAVSQPGDDLDATEDAEDETARLAKTADMRVAAPPPPAAKNVTAAASTASATATAPAGTAAPAASDRAERLRRLAEQRRGSKDADPGYLDQAPPPGRASIDPLATGSVSGEAFAGASLPLEGEIKQPAPVATPTTPVTDPKAVLNAVDQAINLLDQRIQKLCEFNDQGVDGFQLEFRQLDMEDKRDFSPGLCASAVKNPALNRYHDILPYEEHRVILNRELPANSDNYINASMIKGLLQGSPEYIAAQGPTTTTVEHFWKMVAQYRCRVVVMLTRIREANRPKCAEYWPSNGSTLSFPDNNYGPAVTVTSIVERITPCWAEREFTVEEVLADKTRRVFKCMQMHFLDWPDHGVPDSAASFLSFLHSVMSAQRTAKKESKAAGDVSCPLIVHCSAGVGRSGVFCTIYSALTYLPYLGRGPMAEIDVLSIVRKMRSCRRYMVQTAAQYKFCFYAILHAARLYQDGSRKLRERSMEKAKDESGSTEVPVWVFPDFTRDAASKRLQARNKPGMFLVRPVSGASQNFHLSLMTPSGTVGHYFIQFEEAAGCFSVEKKPMQGCKTLLDVVRALKTSRSEIACPLSDFLHRDGVTQEQIDADRARFFQKADNEPPSPSAAAKRQRPSVELNRRSSFALPKVDLTSFAFAVSARRLVVTGREHYLTFLNGEYMQLQELVYAHLVFKCSKPISSDYGSLAGQSVFIYFDEKASAWVFFMRGIGVLAAAEGAVDSPALCTGTWLVLDHGEGIELVPDAKLKVVEREATGASEPSAVATAGADPAKPSVKGILAQQLMEAQQREQQLMRQLSGLQLAIAEQSDDLAQIQEMKTALTEARARQAELESRLAQSHAHAKTLQDQLDKLQGSDETLALAVAQQKQLERESARLQGRVTALEASNSSLSVENESLKRAASVLEQRNGELEAQVSDLQAQMQLLRAQMVAGAARQAASQPGHDSSSPAEPVEDARAPKRSVVLSGFGNDVDVDVDEDMDEEETYLQQDPERAQDYFASHSAEIPSSSAPRGLPSGVVWDEFADEEGDEDDEDGHGDVSYVALKPYSAQSEGEVSLRVGDSVIVTDDTNPSWWTGLVNGVKGRFPASYVGTKM